MGKFFLTTLFALALMIQSVSAAVEPYISADSAILIEASTGRVIYEKNADVQRPPASITKMLTSIICLEWLDPDTPITISQSAAYAEDCTFNWTPGDMMSMRDLNYAMMLVSDNGAAIALAQAVAGNVPDFAAMMNEKAYELGCYDSNFANPNGLPNPNHYSTARDMARIAMYCMQDSRFRDVVGTKIETIHWLNVDKKDLAESTNELFYSDGRGYYYEGATGIKTGWTNAAGGCLAASARRNGIELIAIVMHSADHNTRFEDARKLLDYGFDSVKFMRLVNKDRVEKTVFVEDGRSATVHVGPRDDINFPMFAGEDVSRLRLRYDLPKIVQASVKKNQVLGEAVLSYDGKPMARIPMIAREDVPRGFSVSSMLVAMMSPILSVASNVLVALLA